MITGPPDSGCLNILTSVPQMPATSILRSALSSSICGIGKSRSSNLPAPTFTEARTFSTDLLLPKRSKLSPTATSLQTPPPAVGWRRLGIAYSYSRSAQHSVSAPPGETARRAQIREAARCCAHQIAVALGEDAFGIRRG